MKYLHMVFFGALLLSQVLFTGCRDNSEDQPNGSNGGSVPAGVTRIYGDVRDANAQPISGVALHVVYDVTLGSGIQDTEIPAQTNFYYMGPPLTTECLGTTPIPDGVIVKIYWDNDDNGPDSDDPQPPLCAHPPDCTDGPGFTVNQTEFLMNGSDNWGLGTFAMTRYFVTIGDVLSPNIFFLRIYCSDGNVLWESAAMNIPPGPSDTEVSGWHCTTCSGIPTNPQWALSQSYPNPTVDSVHVGYGLQDAATALLTLKEISTENVDTLLNGYRGAGDYFHDFSMALRPNGLYTYHFLAGSYTAEGLLLKNASGSALVSAPAINITGSSGDYRFDTAAEVNVNLRGVSNENQGIAFLDHLHVVAIKPGYVTLDTLFAVASEESLQVNLTMQPQ